MALVPLRPSLPADGSPVGRRDPGGPEWQYEPKWDGFRCLVFRDGDKVELQSKSGQPLTRYFPELVEARRRAQGQALRARRRDRGAARQGVLVRRLLQRIHPAASRVKKLRAETPALLIVFDLLVDERRHVADREAAARAAQAAGSLRARSILRRPTDRSGCRRRPRKLADAKKWLKQRRRDARRHHRQAPRPALSQPATAAACRRSRTTAAPTAWSAAFATTKASRSSARCCSASTTTTACSIMSASPRRSSARRSRR